MADAATGTVAATNRMRQHRSSGEARPRRSESRSSSGSPRQVGCPGAADDGHRRTSMNRRCPGELRHFSSPAVSMVASDSFLKVSMR